MSTQPENELSTQKPAEPTLCQLCGEPMPKGEEMFNYHGYSGPCPKPPKERRPDVRPLVAEAERFFDANNSRGGYDSGEKRNGFARFAAAFHQANTDGLIAERDREWGVVLCEIGVAMHAKSVHHGGISVTRDDEPTPAAKHVCPNCMEGSHARCISGTCICPCRPAAPSPAVAPPIEAREWLLKILRDDAIKMSDQRMFRYEQIAQLLTAYYAACRSKEK